MADIEDVMSAIVASCTAAVYPKGTAFPSVAKVGIRLYPGWPVSATLDQDLLQGKVNVSVYPLAMERNTTRFQRIWQQESIAAATLSLTSSGSTITVGGALPSPFSPHNLAALINGKGYLYSVQASDTLTGIATGLATAIAADLPGTTSAGAVITLSGANDVTVRVGTVGTSVREVRRQKRLFQITTWAPTPDTRKAVASALDNALQKTAFLTMPDGSAAHVTYFDSPMTDMLSKSRLYRRDLRYFIEYATTEQEDNATVVVGRVTRQDPVTGTDISITDY